MENFFGGLVASKSGKLAGSGENPTAIANMGNSMARVKQGMKLPAEISAQQVINLEEEAGRVDGELELAKMIVQRKKQILNKNIDLHGVNTEWSAVTMEADQRMREIESKHNQLVSRYMLGAATTQAYTDGYTEAYQMSAEIFG
ncbi:MAG: hypothetical protein ACKPE3_22080 [Sphaerospermopsis kisseleviana]